MIRSLLLPLLFLSSSFALQDGKLTQKERDQLSASLKQTKSRLISLVEKLRENQLDFKPSVEQWSIRECLEHLAISEVSLFEIMMANLKASSEPGKYNDIKVTDEQLRNMMTDRSNKTKTSESLEPKGKYKSLKEALDKFSSERESHIKFLQTTNHDLRGHVTPHPAFKALDCYQWLIIMDAHTTRHTLQIEELMKHPNFPK